MLDQRRLGESIGMREASAQPAPSPVNLSGDKTAGRTGNRNAAMMELSRIIPDPEQPRKEFNEEELQALAESIREHELLQPIRVRWCEDHQKYIIVSGERRYRAHLINEATEIAVVIDTKDRSTGEVRVHQLVENIQRSGFKPVEEAQAFAEVMDLEQISAAELARRIKKSRSYVSESLLLLNLPDEVQTAVDAGETPVRDAYRIARDIRQENDSKPAAKTKSKSSKKRKRGMEVVYRTSNGAKVVISFGKKVDEPAIRQAVAEVAEQMQNRKAA